MDSLAEFSFAECRLACERAHRARANAAAAVLRSQTLRRVAEDLWHLGDDWFADHDPSGLQLRPRPARRRSTMPFRLRAPRPN